MYQYFNIIFYFLPIFLSIPISHRSQSTLQDPQTTLVSYDPKIEIALSSSSFSGCNGSIQVNVIGVTNPTVYDYLGLFLADDDWSNKVPIKTKNISVNSNYLKTGNASFNFLILNLRSPLVWYLYQKNNQNGATTITQKSENISFSNYNEPCFPRLSLTKNQNEMQVTWNTRDTNLPSVKYGVISGNYTNLSNAASSTFTADMLCGPPANSFGYRSPGQIHTAKLIKLQPNTTYFYIIGDTYGWSQEYTFISPPSIGSTSPFRFVIFGDMGVSDEDDTKLGAKSQFPAPSVARAIGRENANLAILIGDISYSDGYESSWDSFHHQIQPFASKIPLITSQGNHERDFPGTDSIFNTSDSGGECGIPAETLYPMPYISKIQPWFSFDYALIHFTMMNTEVDYSTNSNQYNWIANDLQSVNKSVTPYIVFTGHRPMYVDSSQNGTSIPGAGMIPVEVKLQHYLEPLLHKNHVPVSFWGHSHNYQRTCPVFNQTCANGNTVHYVVGTAGRGLENSTWLAPKPPAWIRFLNDSTYGYVRATVTVNNIIFEYVAVWNETIEVVDSYTLTLASISDQNSVNNVRPWKLLALMCFILFLLQ